MAQVERIKIVRTNSEDKDFNTLIKLLDEELWQRNSEEQTAYHAGNQLDLIDTVVILYELDKAIACGCFRFYQENIAEIKRMFVKKSHRGRGLSRVLLSELEQWATERDFHSVVLETGKLLIEAIHLYQSQGYQEVNNYGPYATMSNSVCFNKNLI